MKNMIGYILSAVAICGGILFVSSLVKKKCRKYLKDKGADGG